MENKRLYTIILFTICFVALITFSACKAKDEASHTGGTGNSNETISDENSSNNGTNNINQDSIDEVKKDVVKIVENAKQIQINNDITYQTIEGFGASYAWYIDWMTNNPNDQEAYDLFFSEAKTTIIRLKNTYKYNTSFEPKAELELYQEAQKRAKANGEKITVLMSSWSPAAYLKENGQIRGGSSIKKDQNGNYMYDEYGQYWLELIEAYEAYGIPIDIITIQNECDFVADYDGCEFGMVETNTLASYSKAYLAVYKALQTMEDPPKMMGPETMTVDAGQIAAYMKEVFEQAPESVNGIAHHLYAGGTHETPNSFMMSMLKLRENYPNLSKWQTEYYRGDVMQTAWIIHNSLTYEDLNAYLYWNGVWAAPEGLIGFGNPWNKSNWSNEKGYEVYDKFYALRHFSEYIRPGYKRIDVAPTKDIDLLMSAYASDNQDKLSVVAINKSNEDKMVQLHFSAYQVESSNTYTSVCKDGYTQKDIYVTSGPLSENQTIMIPAQGIVTIDIAGKPMNDIVIVDGRKSNNKEENTLQGISKELEVSRQNITMNEVNTDIWTGITGEKIENVANGDHGATAEFKALWSDRYLYIRAEVKDNTPDTRSVDFVNQDSIEVFLNEDHSKPKKYGTGDHHYYITRDNKVKAGNGANMELFESRVTSDQNGYIIELAIPITTLTPKKGMQLGFDIQINDSHGKGLRNYALKWSATSLNSDQSLEGIGTLILN